MTLKNLSNYWRRYSKEHKLWKMIDRIKSLTINEKL